MNGQECIQYNFIYKHKEGVIWLANPFHKPFKV